MGSRDKKRDIELTTVPPAVSKALIGVCEKCGKKLNDGSKDDNPSQLLSKEIKRLIKENNLFLEYRALVTGCQGVCPRDKITVGRFRMNGSSDFLVVEGKHISETAEAIFQATCESKKTN